MAVEVRMNTRAFRGLFGALLASCLPCMVLANDSDSTRTLAGELADLDAKQWVRADVDDKKFEGYLVDFNESTLTLRVDVFENQSLPLHSVSQVWVVTGNHSEEGIKLGAVGGVFLGLVLSYLLPQIPVGGAQSDPTASEVFVVSSLCTVVGAAVGGAVGATQEIWSRIWP
jgi:hypothetical protein